MQTWDPREVLQLIIGLQERGDTLLAGRTAGEEHGAGWSIQDWLVLDQRNVVEALRVMKASEGRKKGSKKPEFNTWDNYPGVERRRRRETQSKLSQLRRLAANGGGEIAT